MPVFILMILALQAVCLAQTNEIDSVYKDKYGTTIFAHFKDGQPSDIWTIKDEKGHYKSGRVISLPIRIESATGVNYPWGSPVGKWHHYDKDSSLKFISETAYSNDFKTIFQKGYYVSEGKPKFDYYRITKRTLLNSIHIECKEDSVIESIQKESFFRYINKFYDLEKESEHFLRVKTVRNWFKWRVKVYDQAGHLIKKEKNIFHTRTQLIKSYDSEKSRIQRPKKRIQYPDVKCWFLKDNK